MKKKISKDEIRQFKNNPYCTDPKPNRTDPNLYRTEKTPFNPKFSIDLDPSHKDSPNFQIAHGP